MTSMWLTIGACTGKIRSTPIPNDTLRTVIALFTPLPFIAITMPSKTWILSLLPSVTLTLTFTVSPDAILGMSVFVVSYIIVTRNIAEIPPSSTIAISALFFLLGLAGLSFGILSASWDKEPGSFFGIENIPMNIQRAKAAFKPATQTFEDKS